MTGNNPQPLKLKKVLAGNPQIEPRYSVTVQSAAWGTIKLADPRSTRALVSLMDMNAVLGGAASHYGGPAGFAELMSALHGYAFTEAHKTQKTWNDLYNLVNDAGHCENGLYALKANYGFADLSIEKLKSFRSFGSPLTGHGESHLFPQAVMMSNGPLGSALPQSQGLAMADAMAGNFERVTITAISDGACMEGEAREAMAAIPGFAKIGKVAPFILIISDNNTGLSGRLDKDVYSMAPSFEALPALGWKVLHLEKGNDLQACFDTISEAIKLAKENPKTPIAIRAKTVKGIGTKKTAESASGGHGFPLKSPTELSAFLSEIYSGQYPTEFDTWINELIALEKTIKAHEVKPAQVEEKIQVGISKAMIQAVKKGLPVVSISSDLAGSTGVAGFRKEFPGSSIDIGIAESNMISTAAGFSKQGYVPVVDTFAQFGVTKGALPLTMASLSQSPMICVFSHTGFQDAADGASHQALSYLAMLSSIPEVDTYCLSSSFEAEALMTQAIEKFVSDRNAGKIPHSTVFFLGRENFYQSYSQKNGFKLGKAEIIQEVAGQNAVTVVASGSCVHEAIQAIPQIQKSGKGVLIVNPGPHNRVDIEVLKSALQKSNGRVVFVEDHQRIGGMAQMISFALLQAGVVMKIKSLAVNGEFGQSSYTAKDLYKKHHIDSDAIAKSVLEF